MPDGFPLNGNDRDHHVQTLISRDLRNALEAQAAFEGKYPAEALASPAGLVARERARPTPRTLFPETHQAAPDTWLEPILRRLRWQTTRTRDITPCRDILASMVNVIISVITEPAEDQFVRLAEHADCFEVPPALEYLDRMYFFAKSLEQSGSLSRRAAGALHAMIEFSRQILPAGNSWHRFVWPYFRSTARLAPGDSCWADTLRRDIETMEPDLRALWLAVFDATNQQLAGANEPSPSCLAALDKLGREQLESGLRRWIDMLKDVPELRLSPVGVVIFRHVLLLCRHLGGAACDDLLYAVACAPWRRPEDTPWLETYLWILGRQSRDRAFACLEALTMNPATATQDVRREYDAALSSFVGEARGVGIDGYRWDTEPALEPHQRRIEPMLQLSAAAVERGPRFDPARQLSAIDEIPEPHRTPAIKMLLAQLSTPRNWFDAGAEVRVSLDAVAQEILEEFSTDPASLHRAAVNRWDWIRGREKEYSPDLFNAWKQCFWGYGCDSGLVPKALAKVDRLPPELLVPAIRTSPGNWKVVELSQKHVAEHGWNVELAKAFREWISTLGTSQTDNQYRAKAEWFLWFEDVLPIKLDTCWGELVRRDLRAMKPAERKAWIALFDQATFTITAKPTKKWLKPAQAAFPKIGAENFRRRFTEWFAPFAAGERLRLTVTGRNVLRLLIWSVLIAGDPAVDEALAGFASAAWKTKDAEKKAAQAEMAFSYVLSERAPAKALQILEHMVESGRACPGSASRRAYDELRTRLAAAPE